MPLFNKNQDQKAKLNQILCNNKLLANQNRYDSSSTPECLFHHSQNAKTPKATDDTFVFHDEERLCDSREEELKTQKKPRPSQGGKRASSFDEEEDLPDAKDFEEFDYAVGSERSSGSMKVRVQVVELASYLFWLARSLLLHRIWFSFAFWS